MTKEERDPAGHYGDPITVACLCADGRIAIYSPPLSGVSLMPHSPADKKKALTRVKRIRGQLDALERALEEGADCAPVLQQLAAVRGAVNGLMSEILESHLREEFAHPASTPEQREAGIDAAVALVRSYLK
jgi:DNA-binding FrmR family transcriptional regulator